MTPQEIKEHFSTFIVLFLMQGKLLVKGANKHIIDGKTCHCLMIEYYREMRRAEGITPGEPSLGESVEAISKKLNVYEYDLYRVIDGWDGFNKSILPMSPYNDAGVALSALHSDAVWWRGAWAKEEE